MQDIIIKTRNLNKKYNDFYAIKDFSFELKHGEICGIIGKNGAGKSTFFKSLSGQIFPTSGEMEIFNKTGKEILEARKRIGFMIEAPEFFGDFTAEQNLEYFRRQKGIPEKNIVSKMLNIVELEHRSKKKFKEYSMGMKQRLGLALSLMNNPDCLILDEPTNGLDPEGRNDIKRLLLKLNRENNVTIMISSHILTEIEAIGSRFVFVKDGKIVKDLSKEELYSTSRKAIKFKVDNTAKATQVLEREFTGIEYKVLADSEIIIYNLLEKSPEINTKLASNGILIYNFTIEGENLEEYFLDLIGGKSYE
ncbi:ABC transporter ATP-binding protein [Miniphocaeibacter halophilus]|uniref:ABC transporter ATP-binding protein n=1 Tax=Miniphocaeibacter halophilus TaxID=2931922 RepID=A0AC61MRJ9_9FIRM|nr:ABC transporter ATP-binding protein [Miniphocaeibacter halophilus]QQK06903.1 ABC transporter ATP-binding protein [Miniphocaeibacter halophilus]